MVFWYNEYVMIILYDNLFYFILFALILFILFIQIFYPKIKVTPKQIEFINFLYKIIIPSTADISFIFNNPLKAGLHDKVIITIVSERKVKGLLLPLAGPNEPSFVNYSSFKKFIRDIKENNFPLKVNISKLENILSKPITKKFIVSKDGIKEIKDAENISDIIINKFSK